MTPRPNAVRPLLTCAAILAALLAADAASHVLLAKSPFGAPAEPQVGGIVGWLLAKQSEFYRQMSGAIRAAKEDGSAVWWLLAISFAYGIFHAAGPGHGKAVIASYLVANQETAKRGIVLSFASGLMQSLVAVVIVGIGAVVLNATAATMCSAEKVVEIASYGLIALLGAHARHPSGDAVEHHDHGDHHAAHADHAHDDHAHGGHDDHHVAEPPAAGTWAAQVITTGLLFVSAALSWAMLVSVGFMHHEAGVKELLPWINSGELQVSWALRVDTLTAVMLVVVTSVSSLVHLYSIGYMDEDPNRPRFFSYLSLFTFAMLMLVTANNLVQLFFGWEGVGLASYLLIGFWFQKPSANAAAIKAFVVNRVGDFGFALGIFAVFLLAKSTDFETIFAAAPSFAGKTINFLGWNADALTLTCLLLFMGAMGKSAQFLLHTWLPDAMEGPTPVSALIHAATMVTAGVFMVARLSPLFELAPNAQAVVMFFGATTAFFAATVGLVQNDIKRIVAYSTCSQLGYMFVAMGAGAYSVGMFHLFTHAFFKALLFLGSGSVIYAMHHEQDIRNMGGLWRKIPYTFAVMTVGTLALTGFPGFAGFFSKDAIIEAAYASHNPFGTYAYFLTVVAAGLAPGVQDVLRNAARPASLRRCA